MKTNHTQGEWTVSNCETLGTVILNNDDESQLIAKLYNETRGNVMLNAKLIAAAPELLEALLLAKSRIDLLIFPKDRNSSIFYKTIISAIEKATK